MRILGRLLRHRPRSWRFEIPGAKSLETVIQIQSEYGKTSYAAFVTQATKMGELHSSHHSICALGLRAERFPIKWTH